jgi:hypothetical protein
MLVSGTGRRRRNQFKKGGKTVTKKGERAKEYENSHEETQIKNKRKIQIENPQGERTAPTTG